MSNFDSQKWNKYEKTSQPENKKQNIYEKGHANLKLTDGEAADVDCKDIHGIQGTLCPEFWSLKYLIITSIDRNFRRKSFSKDLIRLIASSEARGL